MKALTLHQPWASLVALGVKTIETRSWPAPASLIGQPLAIHAGLTKADWRDPVWGPLIEPGTACVLRVGIRPLPLGAVVATCRLAACVPMVHVMQVFTAPDGVPWPNVQLNGPDVVSLVQSDGTCTDLAEQCPYGDFRPGRYAWLLEDAKPTTKRCPACWDTAARWDCRVCDELGYCPPVPARGRQRVWNWEPSVQ